LLNENQRIMRILKWVIVVLSIVVLGFTQEWVKVSLNFHIEKGSRIQGFFEKTANERIAELEDVKNDNPFDYYQSHETIDWYAYLSLSQLKQLKWGATFFFVVVFFFLNKWIIRMLINEPVLNKWLLYTYIGAFATALVIYLLGFLINQLDLFYMVSRKMVGALQSPVPAIMTWAGWRLYKEQKMQEYEQD
jgi:hypothetical protein